MSQPWGGFSFATAGRFDILQATYLYWDAVVAALLKPVLGSRLVVRIVMGGPGGDAERFRGMRFWPLTSRFDGATLRRLVALVIRRGDAFIALNAETRAELLELGASPEKCHVVPNGIEVERFAGITAPVIREGPRRLVCVARLAQQKGHDILLRALPAVRQPLGRSPSALLGDGPERAAPPIAGGGTRSGRDRSVWRGRAGCGAVSRRRCGVRSALQV